MHIHSEKSAASSTKHNKLQSYLTLFSCKLQKPENCPVQVYGPDERLSNVSTCDKQRLLASNCATYFHTSVVDIWESSKYPQMVVTFHFCLTLNLPVLVCHLLESFPDPGSGVRLSDPPAFVVLNCYYTSLDLSIP